MPAVAGDTGALAADAQLPGAAVGSAGRSCEGQRTVIEAPVSQTQHACLSPSHGEGIDPLRQRPCVFVSYIPNCFYKNRN